MQCYKWLMHSENTVFDHAAIDLDRVDECRRVHSRLVGFAKQRAALDACEARDLVYAEEIAIWKACGYTTMFADMEAELGYGPHTAGERLRVSRALIDLPMIAER